MAGKWPMRPLGEIVNNYDARRIPLSSRERENRRGPFPYYGATGVMDHVDDYLFEGLHLLVAEDGSVERPDGTPFLQLVDGKFWVNNHAHVLKGKTDDDTKYIYYALQTVPIRPYVSGSVQAKLSQANLNRVPTPYPPDKSHRQAIAHILGTLDDKIELSRRMSETLEAMARALFKSWFVDFDPVRAKAEGRDPGLPRDLADLFPSEFVDADAGRIPKGWEEKPIGDLAEIVGGSTPRTNRTEYWEGGKYNWVTPKDLSTLSAPVLVDTERKVTELGLAQIGSGLLPPGTVLMSSRAPIGYLAITEIPVAINQGFIAMKPRDGISNLYLLRWASNAHEEILSHANGSTFLEISKSSFRAIRVVVPPAPIMQAFDRLTRPLYDQVVAKQRGLSTLAALRDSLLPRLVSGKIRLNDANRVLAHVVE